MEQRRVLLAIALAFVVLYVWQALFVKPVPKPPTGAPAPASSAAPAASTAETPPPPSEPPRVPAPSAPEATALVSEEAERDVRVETNDVIAVFTNRGARLKSWRLKSYFNANREPQELVERSITGQPLPFTLRTSNIPLDTTLNDSLYTVTGETTESRGPVDLRFEYRNSAGVHALKQFHFEPRSFVVSFEAEIADGDRRIPPTVAWGPAIGDVGEVSRYSKKAEGLAFRDGKVTRLQTKDLANQPSLEGDFRYAGVDDNYFLTVALYTGPSTATFHPVSIPPPADSKEAPRELMS